MPTPPEWGPPELTDLARDYLRLVEVTQGGGGDPADRSQAASARAIVHDQILAALGLTRDEPFDPIVWARATVAAADQRVTTAQAPPFETNQPLERYRLHHAMRLADFAAFLGIAEDAYLALVAGDNHLSAAQGRQIASRLATSPWLINEVAPTPDEEELDEILASIEEGERLGYWRVDAVTGEMEGPVLLAPEPARPPIPSAHLQLAEALISLIAVHPSGADPDYRTLRRALEGRIRSVLELGPGELLDVEAWADDVLDGDISRLRR
ncbi:MAG: hypothetical protein HGA45_41210 [Chloroflexales bacterium]|nr:hypothetical protein [Chloroflexales bacterium]